MKPLKASYRWRRDPLHKGDLILRSPTRGSKLIVAWVAVRAVPNKKSDGKVWVWFWATVYGSQGWRPVKEQAQIMAERASRRQMWARKMASESKLG